VDAEGEGVKLAASARQETAVREVGFYLFPGFAALDLAGPLEVFSMSGLVDPAAAYRITLLSHSGGPVVGSGGIEVASVATPERPLDTLLVVGGPMVPLFAGDVAAIRAHAAAARRTASICTGAFLLAATGLLDGRRVTTHWKSAAQLQRDFPNVRVEADRIYVNDGSVWSSGGLTAGIDLALALVEEDHGVELVRTIARDLVVEHRRHGCQSQYSEMLALDPPSDRIARALVFARSHLGEVLTVDRLAAAAFLSPRQFLRTFRDQTGETPARAVERLRVEAAKALVENSSESIGAIAASLGFADPERMRRAFVRRFGVSPQASRRKARELTRQRDERRRVVAG
jgi:transcriptional regulator GlxA family with amidase domain